MLFERFRVILKGEKQDFSSFASYYSNNLKKRGVLNIKILNERDKLKMNCELKVTSNRLDRLVERDCWASNRDRRLPRRM